MNSLLRSLCLLSAAVFSLVSLTSCYFNSAGLFFDEASHKAAIFTSDIKPGHSVYQSRKTGRYYVEMKHYRADTPVIVQYPSSDQDSSAEEISYRDKVIVEIPTAYANYLMGVGSYVYPSFLSPTDYDSDFKKKCDAYVVKQSPPEIRCNYTYQSPYAGWWYIFGALEWVCIDLPITCAENLAAGIFAFMAVADDAKKNPGNYSSGSSGGGGGGGWDAVEIERYNREQNILNNAAMGRPF